MPNLRLRANATRPAQKQFELLQALATSGASDVEAFEPQSGEKGLLVVHEEDTEVYLADWEGEDVRGFAKIQSLETKHGHELRLLGFYIGTLTIRVSFLLQVCRADMLICWHEAR
eukprot:s4838_g5.t1